jgi:hypothetical protein
MNDNGEDSISKENLAAINTITDDLAQSLTVEMFDISARMNQLRPITRMRSKYDDEGKYIHDELRRLQAKLHDVSLSYTRLHNLQVVSTHQSLSTEPGDNTH